jgi:hypothetical protein
MAFIVIVLAMIAGLWAYFKLFAGKPCCAECAEKAALETKS